MQKQLILLIDAELVKHFKSYCALNNTNMSDVIRTMIKQKIEQSKEQK